MGSVVGVSGVETFACEAGKSVGDKLGTTQISRRTPGASTLYDETSTRAVQDKLRQLATLGDRVQQAEHLIKSHIERSGKSLAWEAEFYRNMPKEPGSGSAFRICFIEAARHPGRGSVRR